MVFLFYFDFSACDETIHLIRRITTITRITMNNEFEYPRLDNYYSDYIQLAFSFEKDSDYQGIYTYTEDEFGDIVSQFMVINLAKCVDYSFEEFIEKFCRIWIHEYLHLVGLSDNGISILSQLGFPVDGNN